MDRRHNGRQRERAGRLRLAAAGVCGLLAAGLAATALATPAAAASNGVPYEPVTGSGSSWAGNIVDQWTRDLRGQGITINYSPSGSTAGRTDFRNGLTAFGVSEIPYGRLDTVTGQRDAVPTRPFAYAPLVGGGLSLAYNLRIDGQRVTSLRLSSETIARIFTRSVTRWNDPAIAAENPGLTLPSRPITPVVRSDGSGSTAVFTSYLSAQQPQLWTAGVTSQFPQQEGVISQNGSVGVAGYVAAPAAEGAITYVENAYALAQGLPAAKVLNVAGYYAAPTPQNVAVALNGATINTDAADPNVYLTAQLDGVFGNVDARAYPISSYSYAIVPTNPVPDRVVTAGRGRTLSDFLSYAVCEGQRNAADLGYAPLPINLVEAALEQIRKIPPSGDEADVTIANCGNPTFSPTGENLLIANAPQPAACDKAGPLQCGTPAETPTASPSPTSTPGDGDGGGNGNGGGGVGGFIALLISLLAVVALVPAPIRRTVFRVLRSLRGGGRRAA